MHEKRRHSQQALKCYFIVQGEGRGHWRQAMTLKKWLNEAGAEVVGIAFGESASNPFPPSFFAECDVPLYRFQAPSFVKDAMGEEILMGKTLLQNSLKLSAYTKEVSRLKEEILRFQPDVVLNFYDPIGGLAMRLLPKKIRKIALANQYSLTLKNFDKPKGFLVQKRFLSIFNAICAGKAERWAMSWLEVPTDKSALLFPPIFTFLEDESETPKLDNADFIQQNYILVYMVNYGYGQQVIDWCRKNPQQMVICFWNHPEHLEIYQALPNLRFEPLDKNRFASAFENCQQLVCSAGFQTVTEALNAGKVFRVVPVKGQYEQIANAHFLSENRLASCTPNFDLSDITHYQMEEGQLAFLRSGKMRYLKALLSN